MDKTKMRFLMILYGIQTNFSFSGSQFKIIVEYAPSQRIPKHWPKKDGREGTIFKGNQSLFWYKLTHTFFGTNSQIWSTSVSAHKYMLYI